MWRALLLLALLACGVAANIESEMIECFKLGGGPQAQAQCINQLLLATGQAPQGPAVHTGVQQDPAVHEAVQQPGGQQAVQAPSPNAQQAAPPAAAPRDSTPVTGDLACAVGTTNLTFTTNGAQAFAVAWSYDPFDTLYYQDSSCPPDSPNPCSASASGFTVTIDNAAGIWTIEDGNTAGSVHNFAATLTSSDLSSAISCAVISNTFPFRGPWYFTSGGDLNVLTGYYAPTTGAAWKMVIQCIKSVFPPTSKACCDAKNKLAAANTTCRPSSSACRGDARCDGISGDCPANPPVRQGYSCPWYPRGFKPYNTYASAAHAPVRAQMLYGHKWPPCEGVCYNGACALRFDIPACCTVPEPGMFHHHTYYDAALKDTTEAALDPGNDVRSSSSSSLQAGAQGHRGGAGYGSGGLYCRDY